MNLHFNFLNGYALKSTRKTADELRVALIDWFVYVFLPVNVLLPIKKIILSKPINCKSGVEQNHSLVEPSRKEQTCKVAFVTWLLGVFKEKYL